jgi:hypothetical protein
VARLTLIFLFLLCACGAQDRAIPDAELARPPSAERISAIVESAGREGWGTWSEPLRRAAVRVYERDAAAAAPWYFLYRWSALLSTPKARAIQGWIQAVEKTGGAHSNMARNYALPPGSLAAVVSPEFQRWALGSPAFSEEFFETILATDQPIETLGVLQKLHAANPALFAEYASLALAIGVVFDVPPPPDWPHGQVLPAVLPRQLPDPVAAFNHWTRIDRANATAHRFKRLPAAELKFIVDSAAPFTELTWAQRNVALPLAELGKAYDMIRYRKDRLEQARYTWPNADYRLETILKEGGICVDQAYFATSVGKARGVPTILFRGAGLDGRHAWFGFLSSGGWVLDVGRYAEQKFVAGIAYDPQTWRAFNDHELKFVSERFRATPLYRLSVIHAAFAEEYLADRNFPAALSAAREAANREPRNIRAWNVLIAAQRAAAVEPRTREGTLRDAAKAFQRYPDLEIDFSRALVAHLRASGETSLATVEEQRIARKYQGTRSDLSVAQAAAMLQHSVEHDDLGARVRSYERILDTYGHGAGMDFFDKVVQPFVEHLRQQKQQPAALQAISRARRILKVEPGKQLDQELRQLEEKVRKG